MGRGTHSHTHTQRRGYKCLVMWSVFKWNCLIRHKHIYSVEYLPNNLIRNLGGHGHGQVWNAEIKMELYQGRGTIEAGKHTHTHTHTCRGGLVPHASCQSSGSQSPPLAFNGVIAGRYKYLYSDFRRCSTTKPKPNPNPYTHPSDDPRHFIHRCQQFLDLNAQQKRKWANNSKASAEQK